MNYEEKMKDRDNEFLYSKCVKQYHCIMNYQFKMREYKDRIKELEEENEKLKLTLEALDVPENMSYYFRERYKIMSARMHKAMRIYEECGELNDFSTCDLEMYQILKGEE